MRSRVLSRRTFLRGAVGAGAACVGLPLLEAMLNGPSGNLESSTNRLVMDDVKPEVLKEFLRFLYTDQVRNITVTRITVVEFFSLTGEEG